MSPADLAAYIGAAAWLPQIATWIYRSVAKPKLSVSPASTVSLGYDDSGPAVTLGFSISSERHDAIVESIEVHLRHEQGEERSLLWVEEGDLSAQHLASVTAIKVSTETLTDRRIVFRDVKFGNEIRKRRDDLIGQLNFLAATDIDPFPTVLKSKEAHEARQQFNQNWYWKPGAYRLEIKLRSKFGMHSEAFKVILSQADSDFLKQNCDLFPEFLAASLLGATGQPGNFPKWRVLASGITRF
jgi:hypothetical protein